MVFSKYLRKVAHALRLRGPLADEPRARVLHGLVVGLLLYLWIIHIPIMVPLFVARKLASSLIVFFVTLVYGTTLVLVHRGSIRPASQLLLAGMWLSSTILIIFDGGIHSPGIVHYVNVPILAAWLLGARVAGAAAAVCLGGSLVLALLEQNGFVLPRYFPGAPLGIWTSLALATIATAVPVVIILRILNETLEKLRRAHDELETRVRDRTMDLARTYAALQDSAQRYHSLFNEMTEGFALHEIICDEKGRPCDYRFLDVNPSFERLTTLRRDDVIGKTMRHVLPHDDPKWIAIYGEVAQTGKAVHFDNYSPVLERYYDVLAYRPAPGQFAVLFTDITDRKRIEAEAGRRALEAEEGQRILGALMEYIPEGITIAAAPDTRVILVSKHGQQLIGRPAGTLEVAAEKQAETWALYHADGATRPDPDEMPLVRAVRSGEVTHDEEWVLQDAAGRKHWILVNAGPMRDREGNITGAVAAWRDITERRQFEERLRHAQRLESIGVLAGGIAHDFNNLLTGIMGGASLLSEDLPADDPNSSVVESILKSSQRAADLTRQLLAYSGKGRFFVENLDLSRTVREIVRLAQGSIPRSIQLELDLAGNLPAVEADRGQIHQIVMNLVTNAAEAIGESNGTVSIQTGVQEVDEQYILQHDPSQGEQHAAPGLFVFVEVRDTGCGMDPETMSKVFDPFFTTKFTGRGLGLAAAQGIVRGHKGLIRVSSSHGQGSCFRVLLPAAGAVSRKPQVTQPLPLMAGSGVVLVIDDEEAVRLNAKTALERTGYTVLLAENGERAVEIFSQAANRMDCVILDMTMPVMSGEETLRRLQAIRADVPVVLSSGYNQVEAIRRFTGKGLAGFLGKPYTSAKLAATVKSVCAGK